MTAAVDRNATAASVTTGGKVSSTVKYYNLHHRMCRISGYHALWINTPDGFFHLILSKNRGSRMGLFVGSV